MATNQLSSFGGGSAAVQSDDLLAFDPRVSRAGATVGDWNQSQYATSTFGVGFDDRAAASARNSDLSSLGMQPGRGLQFASQDEGIVSNGAPSNLTRSRARESGAVWEEQEKALFGNKAKVVQMLDKELDRYMAMVNTKSLYQDFRDRESGAEVKRKRATEDEMDVDGAAPGPNNAAAPRKAKKRKERPLEKDWSREKINYEDEYLQDFVKALATPGITSIILIDTDSFDDSKIGPLIRHMLLLDELPEGVLLLVCKGSYFVPKCLACSTPFQGKMKEVKNRILLRKHEQQPQKMFSATFYTHIIVAKAPPTVASLFVLTKSKFTTAKVGEAAQSTRVRTIVVDISDDKTFRFASSSALPPTVKTVIQHKLDTFLAAGMPNEHNEETLRSAALNLRAISSGEADEAVKAASKQVLMWLTSLKEKRDEGHPSTFPATRSKLQNAIKRDKCRVRVAVSERDCVEVMFGEKLLNYCPMCTSITLGDLINVDYSAIATKYGSEASQVLRKAVSGIFMAKVPSIPKTEEALLNQLRNFNSVSILAMPNQVVQWLQKSGCIRSESSGSNESAASLFSSNDERIEYVWEICYEALDNLIDDERRRSLNSSRERDASAMDVDQQNTSLEGLIASHPISSISTWQQLPLRKSQTLSASVSRRGWSTPLLLQQLVAPVVLGSDNVPASCDICIEAPKAAGKTGCYLVPLLDMTDVEIQLPQYIVVVPTREVAEQLETDFIETGGRDLGITVKCCAGGSDKSVDLQASQIIVGSPQRLAELLKRKMFPTSGIQMIVFDDVEQALAKNEADVASVLSSFALTKTRVMFIGTRQLDDTIPSRFKRLRREILSRSSELFSVTVDPALGYKGLLSNKISHKIQTILEEKLRNGAVQQAMAASPFRQCVIVVPDKQRAAQITKTLKADKNLSVFGLGDGFSAEQNSKLITEFKGTNNAALVTQLDAIRGIDVPNTDLVVITKPFDSLDDYIHAAGITGRTKGGVDGNCRVVSIALPSERSMLRTNDFNFALV